jgi:hypothetical protein
MIVDDFDPFRISCLPLKADAPAIIDPDTPLPLSVAFQGLKAVRPWQPIFWKIFDAFYFEIVIYCQPSPVSLSFPGNFRPFMPIFHESSVGFLRRLARSW